MRNNCLFIIFIALLSLCLVGSAQAKDCLHSPQKSQTKHYSFGYFYSMETRVCKKCDIEKSFELFEKSKHRLFGITHRCKKCVGLSKPKRQIKIYIEDLPNEIWKDIVGYESIYMVSNFGRIKSLERFKKSHTDAMAFVPNSILKPAITDGYLRVVLQKNGKAKQMTVHRLVATAFIQNMENKPCINHINGIKVDNSATNLEWVTVRENTIHAFRTGLIVKRRMPKPFKYLVNGEEMIFTSFKEAEKVSGIPISVIKFRLYNKTSSIKRDFVFC